MARLARRTAGRRVAARSQRLSDDLLLVEEAVFAEMAATLRRDGEAARKQIIKILNTGREARQLASHAALLRDLREAHSSSLRRMSKHSLVLLDVTFDETISSLGEELLWCERTLAKRYRGIAGQAVRFVDQSRDTMIGQAASAFEAATGDALAWFVLELKKQLLLAGQYADDEEQVLARLFAERANRPGIGGRGVWLRSGSALNAAARRSSVSLMNAVRESAMLGFNRIGESRG